MFNLSTGKRVKCNQVLWLNRYQTSNRQTQIQDFDAPGFWSTADIKSHPSPWTINKSNETEPINKYSRHDTLEAITDTGLGVDSSHQNDFNAPQQHKRCNRTEIEATRGNECRESAADRPRCLWPNLDRYRLRWGHGTHVSSPGSICNQQWCHRCWWCIKTSATRHPSIDTMICKSVDDAIAIVKTIVQASKRGVCQASDRQKKLSMGATHDWSIDRCRHQRTSRCAK